MNKTPNYFLFKAKIGKNKTPLFENQIDLAQCLMNLDNHQYKNKRESTIRSSLSQIFTGERNVSKNLRKALEDAIKAKFDKDKNQIDKLIKELFDSFKLLSESRLIEKRFDIGDKDFFDLRNETEKATEIVIVTLEPAELHNSIYADELKNQLLEKLGVIESENPNLISAKYKFFLPSSKNGLVAIKFWKNLRNRLIEEYSMDINEANNILVEVNDSEKLEVYIIDEVKCCLPIIALNYNTVKIACFCVSYIREDPSVARYSDDVTQLWKDTYFKDLLKYTEKDSYKLKFNDII